MVVMFRGKHHSIHDVENSSDFWLRNHTWRKQCCSLQRWSPQGRPWPREHILKSLALASKPQVLGLRLGLKASTPRKLPCPRLEDSIIF